MSLNNLSKVVILHNQVSDQSSEDELDVIHQIESVTKSLQEMAYEVDTVPVSLDLQSAASHLQSIRPQFIFNLVESVDGTGRLIYFAPALLDRLGLAYTGCGTDALYLTTNKPVAKTWMQSHQIPTPAWTVISNNSRLPDDIEFPVILKPVWEDASVGLNDSSVIHNKKDLSNHLERNIHPDSEWFLEAYIPGREFNISILAGDKNPEVLPAAEIDFIDYPADKPRIVDYRAKWETDSFEYKHTVRRFEFPQSDTGLLEQLQKITRQCWDAFSLRGFARVDFRVDQDGRPWVLEVNANPCISPDSGFVAAAQRAGLDFTTVVRRIVNDMPFKQSNQGRS